ncbi:GNAT family N-acetyltransferase [Bacillus sp. REN3]|uniref:GNAT family N-acetyltransferase n=1 Tax=Bacillus sp. REN3 TaxID=2802440 RepID=UPI001AED9AD0|nr:GNAT family N-acetyltransferase [Bacillus sp. REN3]
MAIRRAHYAENDYLIKLTGKVLKESSMGYGENSVQNAYQLFMPFIQNGAYFLVDEEYRRLKGWILLGKDWNMLTNQTIGVLLSVYVFPAYRKAGIGEKLTVAAIEELKAQGIKTIQLNIFQGNPSRIMCEKLGFKEVSTTMELYVQ